MPGPREFNLTPAKLPISRVRQELCPLVDHLERAPGGKIAITVGEQVAAYLVAPDKLAELEEKAAAPGRTRPSLVGSIEIVGDLMSDRVIVASALRLDLPLVTADRAIAEWGGVEVIW